MSEPSTAAPPGLRDWPGFQLYKAGWWLEQRCEQELAGRLGLRGRHFTVLTMLQASSDLSQQQMAAYMSLDPTLMVALIDELERQGLCRRTRHPSDRRRYAITITPAGSALLEQGLAIVGEIEQEILAPLSEPERQELARMLTRVMEPYWFAKRHG
jgi:DNA-binding MarR family transcriptional regulator